LIYHAILHRPGKVSNKPGNFDRDQRDATMPAVPGAARARPTPRQISPGGYP
jgi:hypothetical protein